MRKLLFALPLAILFVPQATLALCCKCYEKSDAYQTPICMITGNASCQTLAQTTPNKAAKNLICIDLKESQCVIQDFENSTSECIAEPIPELLYKGKPAIATTDPKNRAVITPTLNVPIPGLNFGSTNGSPWLAQYISGVYRYLIGLSVIAAAIMLVYGGFLMILGSTGAKIQSGKQIVTEALIGLGLVLGAVTILRTVNPDTTSLSLPNITPIATKQVLTEEFCNAIDVGKTLLFSNANAPPALLPKGQGGYTIKPWETKCGHEYYAADYENRCRGVSCKSLAATDPNLVCAFCHEMKNPEAGCKDYPKDYNGLACTSKSNIKTLGGFIKDKIDAKLEKIVN